MMNGNSKKLRWGILGTGRIAGLFAEGLTAVPQAELRAVGSRTRSGAEAFVRRHGGSATVHGSYEALVADGELDVVYVATPHSMHEENTLLCLNSGKPVLCEKPFAIHAGQARRMVDRARERGLFLMEAMWTRFLPSLITARQLLRAGAIGQPRMLQADFGFRAAVDPTGRLFEPGLGGGSLLDVGVYPVSLASWVFGKPTHQVGLAHLGDTGVDEQAGIILRHENGALSVLASAIRTETPQTATILGTAGSIHFPTKWWQGKALTVTREGRKPETTEFTLGGNGYHFQAMEVSDCLKEGRLESETMPLDETIEIMDTMDRLRSEWGLRYPMDPDPGATS